MKMISLPAGPLHANCYILYKNSDCVIIDPGDFSTVNSVVQSNGLSAKFVILTHGHFDHCCGAKSFADRGAEILYSKADEELIYKGLYATEFGLNYVPVKADKYLRDGNLTIGDFDFEVMFTPGHTKGSVCFIAEDKIFTGDTLFKGGMGRTDLEGGDFSEMLSSLKKLFSLKKDYTVYPGHGDQTTLFKEKSNYADR